MSSAAPVAAAACFGRGPMVERILKNKFGRLCRRWASPCCLITQNPNLTSASDSMPVATRPRPHGIGCSEVAVVRNVRQTRASLTKIIWKQSGSTAASCWRKREMAICPRCGNAVWVTYSAAPFFQFVISEPSAQIAPGLMRRFFVGQLSNDYLDNHFAVCECEAWLRPRACLWSWIFTTKT